MYPPWLHSECEVVFSDVPLSDVVSKRERRAKPDGARGSETRERRGDAPIIPQKDPAVVAENRIT
jgi:hypothetical protein